MRKIDKPKVVNPIRQEEILAEHEYCAERVKLAYKALTWFKKHNYSSNDNSYKSMQQKLYYYNHRKDKLRRIVSELEKSHGLK